MLIRNVGEQGHNKRTCDGRKSGSLEFEGWENVDR